MWKNKDLCICFAKDRSKIKICIFKLNKWGCLRILRISFIFVPEKGFIFLHIPYIHPFLWSFIHQYTVIGLIFEQYSVGVGQPESRMFLKASLHIWTGAFISPEKASRGSGFTIWAVSLSGWSRWQGPCEINPWRSKNRKRWRKSDKWWVKPHVAVDK